jgi:hypothetical protein
MYGVFQLRTVQKSCTRVLTASTEWRSLYRAIQKSCAQSNRMHCMAVAVPYPAGGGVPDSGGGSGRVGLRLGGPLRRAQVAERDVRAAGTLGSFAKTPLSPHEHRLVYRPVPCTTQRALDTSPYAHGVVDRLRRMECRVSRAKALGTWAARVKSGEGVLSSAVLLGELFEPQVRPPHRNVPQRAVMYRNMLRPTCASFHC